MSKKVQDKILYFLYQNVNVKFSVGQIWEELAGKEEISYSTIQNNIQRLQYQRNSQIKTEIKYPYKMVWIEVGNRLKASLKNSQEQGLKPRHSTPRSNEKSVYADNPTLDTNNQDVCICGHSKIWHIQPDNKHYKNCKKYLSGEFKFCPCKKFKPKEVNVGR